MVAYKNVEIIVTNKDSLKRTGFGSLAVCQTICDILSGEKTRCCLTSCSNRDDLENVVHRRPDFVILADKYIRDEEETVWLAEYFADTKIRFTGSSSTAITFDMDKQLAKRTIQNNHLLTAPFFTATVSEYANGKDLPLAYPLFMKPSQSSNSEGVDENSIVHDRQQFTKQLTLLESRYKGPILVESYLPGREFTVAIIRIGDSSSVAALEIIIPQKYNVAVLSNSIKQNNQEKVSTILDPILLDSITNFALHCFDTLGATNFGRVDLKLDSKGQCAFIEINLTPGLNENSSYFPQAYKLNKILTYHEMVLLMMQADEVL